MQKYPIDDDIPPSTEGSIYTENSSSKSDGGDVVAISIANYPNGEDRGALVL